MKLIDKRSKEFRWAEPHKSCNSIRKKRTKGRTRTGFGCRLYGGSSIDFIRFGLRHPYMFGLPYFFGHPDFFGLPDFFGDCSRRYGTGTTVFEHSRCMGKGNERYEKNDTTYG